MRQVHERADVVALLAEVFRTRGYEGASLGQITAQTGLGKGSLYHFFPGGKDEMASAVLAHVDAWFATNVFEPLDQAPPDVGLDRMWAGVDTYFRSGARICLVGGFALDATRDRFAAAIHAYFRRWIATLQSALVRGGRDAATAAQLAEDVVSGIQGALVLARAVDEPAFFGRSLARLKARVDESA